MRSFSRLRHNDLRTALNRVRYELAESNDAPFAEIKYDIVFKRIRVLEVLGMGDVKTAIEAYIKKYN